MLPQPERCPTDSCPPDLGVWMLNTLPIEALFFLHSLRTTVREAAPSILPPSLVDAWVQAAERGEIWVVA